MSKSPDPIVSAQSLNPRAPEPVCLRCGTEIAAALLACPGCGALVHADELKKLAQSAESASSVEALVAWRRALELLPPGSRQHEVILGKVKALVEQIDRSPGAPAAAPRKTSNGKWGVIGGALMAVILLASKFKFLLALLLTKGKLLLLGFTKMGTVFSMLGSFAVYMTMFGWQFVAGFILSIYVHEMGHVAALRRFGIKATAPMFIPGLGAFIRARERMHSPIEEARVGLAGPWWGLGATLVAAGAALFLHSPLAAALAHVGAWLNLFNLTPVWQLDGSHAFRALSRPQRWIVVAVTCAVLYFVRDLFVGLVAVVAAVRAFSRNADERGDSRTLVDFCFLVISLGALAYAFSDAPSYRK
jgi:Zn-dependent protease